MMLTALVCLVLGAAVAARLDPEPLTVGLIYSLHLCADCRWRNPLNRFRRESTARTMLFNTVRRLETKRSQWRPSADRCCGVASYGLGLDTAWRRRLGALPFGRAGPVANGRRPGSRGAPRAKGASTPLPTSRLRGPVRGESVKGGRLAWNCERTLPDTLAP